MKKVAVVTDSSCCLPPEIASQYDITIVPLQIVYEGKSYRDGIDMTAGEVYEIMRRKENLPTTSTPSAGFFLTTFRQLSKKTDTVLCITLTGLQSKTFESASAAKQMAKEELPDTTIEVLDSRSVSSGLGFIAREAARVAREGAELPKVIEVARHMMGKVNFLAVLDTLYYLARLGRIARAAAWAGSLLSVKPILEHSPAIGETMPVARPRTRQKAIERMLNIMAQRVGNARAHVMVHHADELEAGQKMLATIQSRFNCVESYLTEFTPVMGVHTGPGLLAVGFYTD